MSSIKLTSRARAQYFIPSSSSSKSMFGLGSTRLSWDAIVIRKKGVGDKSLFLPKEVDRHLTFIAHKIHNKQEYLLLLVSVLHLIKLTFRKRW